MITDVFLNAYNKLNGQQKKAVDAIEGPVMVVAGPGTGKTQILTLRIANILRKTDMEPDNVLALTFTESGVASMRRRLMELIGGPAYSVAISTFHGFCNDIIANHPESFPRIIGSEPVTEVDRVRIVERALEETSLELLRPYGDPTYYVGKILSSIDKLKQEGVSVERFEELVAKELHIFEGIEDLYYDKGAHKGKMKGVYQKRQKNINKINELALLYRQYEESLAKGKWYDYADMIMEVLTVLQRDENLLLILQEQYQYVLVDEHQDTNNAQNRIVELLCGFHADPNIFVVGDEKQAIYRFQGASLENFLYFQKLYPSAELIVLEENYRSTQIILDAAHGVIPGKKELRANAPHKARPIRVAVFSNDTAEYYGVARDIKEAIEGGTAPGDIAILYRNNRDAFPMMEMLERMEVSAAIESDQDIMRDEEIGKLVRILRAVNAFGSPEEFISMLHINFIGIEPLDLYKSMEYANRNRMSIYDVARSEHIINDEKLKIDKPAAILSIYGKMAQWNAAAKNKGLAESVEMIMRESGLLAHILGGTEPVEKMEKLTAFFDEIKKLVEAHRDAKLSDLFVHLDTMERHGLSIKRSIGGHGIGKVHLMTAHRSKGLEFDHVYIINAFDTHWGNKKSREVLKLPMSVFSRVDAPIEEEGDENADERRLFYVALTRAKQSVTITYAKENVHKREQLPSLFIGEIREDLRVEMETELYEKELGEHKEMVFKPRAMTATDIRDVEYIKELFMRNGLSATALNNYLTCPWRYFYSNLLRIPGAPEKHQMFGTAVHNALQDFFNAMSERGADRQFLLDTFTYHLGKQALSGRDFEDAKKKGLSALGGYYDTYHESWRGNVLTEYAVNDVMMTPEIRLTGKIDKLEFLDVGNKVNVVDYKTGKPKSRVQIEGKSKEDEEGDETEKQDGSGGIKRQLTFYKILLDRQGKYDMVSADVDFVEPMQSGKYKKEMFEILPEEVHALEKEIMRVGTEIIEGSFWEARCDDAECEYCALRNLMA